MGECPLAFRSLDEPYTVYGLVAQKIERDPDGLWVRFYLNPKARFADDTPITAQDVAFTYDTLMTKGSLSYRMLYGEVKDRVIEGPLQIRFDFKNNQNRTLALDLASLHILPEHWWKTRDFTAGGATSHRWAAVRIRSPGLTRGAVSPLRATKTGGPKTCPSARACTTSIA